MAILDISVPLALRTAPFPGDTPFTRQWPMRIAEGQVCNVSAISLSPHVGTHADAPYHYDDHGATIDEQPLELYCGRALVVRVTPEDGYITVAALRKAGVTQAERILLCTGSYRDPTYFDPGFAALAPEAVDYLATCGVRLIGVDTPSVDPAASKDLPAHGRCREHGICLLEMLQLTQVEQGEYELIALPLAIVGSDSSPVRAVLRTL